MRVSKDFPKTRAPEQIRGSWLFLEVLYGHHKKDPQLLETAMSVDSPRQESEFWSLVLVLF